MLVVIALVAVVWFVWAKAGYKNPISMISGK
jgi:hypothetical protein